MNYTPVVWKMLMLMMRRDKRALLKKREKISLDISAIRERLEGVSEKEYKIKLELHKLSSQLSEMKDEEAELNEYKHVRTESCGSCVGDGDAGGVVDVHGPAHDGERVDEGGRDGEGVVSAAAGRHVHLREDQEGNSAADLVSAYKEVKQALGLGETVEDLATSTAVSSMVYANRPGDGSAREQAASCQRVLGGGANIAIEYATKRYRSNVINWGMLPFVTSEEDSKTMAVGDYVYVPNVCDQLFSDSDDYKAYVISGGVKKAEITLHLGHLSDEEKEIIAAGCLINYYANSKA